MRKMTEDNLNGAFAGESQAHMKYLVFADKAENEGRPNVARLFRAIAYAERVHATGHFNKLGLLGGTADNLQEAIDGETYEVEEMYPAFRAVAELQGEKGALQSINFAFEAEKIHAGMYQKAKQEMESGNDIKLGAVYICPVCGHTVEDEAPDRCPVCGATRDKFKKY